MFLKQARTNRPSMGLERDGQCLFEGALTTVSPAIVRGQVIHGLTNSKDIKAVEDWYGQPFKNLDFYGSLVLNVPHTLTVVDPSNGEDVLRMGVLAAQGKLAPSVQEQDDPNQNYQFVKYNPDAEANLKATLTTKRITASAKLVQIKEKEPDYLIALCAYICNNAAGIKGADAAFLKLGEYIEGKLTANKNDAVDYFLRTLDPVYGGEVTKDHVFVSVDAKRAIHLNVIRYDTSRGVHYNAALPESNYGRTFDEVVEFLSAFSNSDHLGGGPKDTPYSVRGQIARIEEGKNFTYKNHDGAAPKLKK